MEGFVESNDDKYNVVRAVAGEKQVTRAGALPPKPSAKAPTMLPPRPPTKPPTKPTMNAKS